MHTTVYKGRYSGLTVSKLDSGLSDQALAGSLYCVLGQDTLLSQYLSSPRCINGYSKFNAGGNSAID